MSRAPFTASVVSLLTGSILCGMKFLAYYSTGSTAILSDALESIINVVAAGVASFAIHLSRRGADQDHHFGHGRIEYFSAGLEGTLIAIAGVLIFYESVIKIIRGGELHNLGPGMILIAITVGVNLLLGLYLIRTGKTHHSRALIADGKHILTDVYSSIALVGGLGAVYLTGWTILDPIIALIMATWILYSGLRLLLSSFDSLMDRADPELVHQVVKSIRRNAPPGMIHPHRLRIRELGPELVVDFHAILPAFMTIETLHEIEVTIAGGLSEDLNRTVDLMLHTDPCIPENCVDCDLDPCNIRSRDHKNMQEWTSERLLADIHHPFMD